ncbi:unnamed protein product [Zymoseptoria tritici ST99CH_3D7]|uniref:Secreted protein n=1 Tax=Zymoseptoria tritici (strain ST99CH_3D7) TaxID=1276538 RepID=A0A1X7RTI7_ZYMT9|nr:unnamed protein product [Zymoseptoria tritici ST99CH_3D7]
MHILVLLIACSTLVSVCFEIDAAVLGNQQESGIISAPALICSYQRGIIDGFQRLQPRHSINRSIAPILR